jgi:hypothetical protein
MSNIVIPYRGFLQQSNGGPTPWVPPYSGDLKLDLDPSRGVWETYGGPGAATPVPVTADAGGPENDASPVGYMTNWTNYTTPLGYTMTARQQTDNRKPRWYKSDTNRNNKPYLRFDDDGSNPDDYYLIMESQSNAFRFDQASIYVVCDINTSDANSLMGLVANSSNYAWDDGYNLHVSSGGQLKTTVGDVSFYDANLNTMNASTLASVYSFTFKGSTVEADKVNALRYKSAGSSVSSRDNGPVDDDDITPTGAGDSYPDWASSANTVIGASRADLSGVGTISTSRCFVGKLYRVLMYDVCHTEAEQLAVMNAIGTEFNI